MKRKLVTTVSSLIVMSAATLIFGPSAYAAAGDPGTCALAYDAIDMRPQPDAVSSPVVLRWLYRGDSGPSVEQPEERNVDWEKVEIEGVVGWVERRFMYCVDPIVATAP